MKAAAAVVAKIPSVEPQFNVTVGWSNDYDQLFAREYAATTGAVSLVSRAFESGRVLLAGRGGAGKTVLMGRVAREALGANILPCLILPKRWTAPDYALWARGADDETTRPTLLLERFAAPSVRLSGGHSLPAAGRKLLLVDGLNEVARDVGQEIITALDDLVWRVPGLAVIVSDRLIRRHLRAADRWLLARLEPLSHAEVTRVLRGAHVGGYDVAAESAKSLLEIPFFLDRALRSKELAPKSVDALRSFLRDHAIGDAELSDLARAAFELYAVGQSRTFSRAAIEKEAGQDIVDRLIASGALTEMSDGSHLFFSHHLIHDYLASYHLARSEGLWYQPAFDHVTFGAASFDTLGMVGQQLRSEEAELFVRRVYDWNPYGAAYVLAEGRTGEAVPIGATIETVMLLLMADRSLDIIVSTAQKGRDALALFPSATAKTLMTLSSREELVDFASKLQHPEKWFEEWKNIYCRRPRTAVADTELGLIQEENSIRGWTFANVLKTLALEDSQLAVLRRWLPESGATVRWRIVHVLGAFPVEENAATLDSLSREDEDSWVRYGAIRSLMELAAWAGAGLRSSVMDRVAEYARVYVEDRYVLSELMRAMMIKRPIAPPDWQAVTTKVTGALYASTESNTLRKGLLRLHYELGQLYG